MSAAPSSAALLHFEDGGAVMRQTDPRTYRLELADDELGEARTIEFNAHGAYAALNLAREYCAGRAGALFEDGRRLAKVRRVGPVWQIA